MIVVKRAFLIGLGLSVALTAQALEFESGEWETQARFEVNGGLLPVPPIISEKCLTPEDPIPNTVANKTNCVISDVTKNDQEVGWVLHCDDKKGSLHGVGKLTFEEKAFAGVMDMEIRDDDGELENKHSFRMEGKRKGDCKEPR